MYLIITKYKIALAEVAENNRTLAVSKPHTFGPLTPPNKMISNRIIFGTLCAPNGLVYRRAFAAKPIKSPTMLKNYIKIAFRSLWRHKAFSILKITGLAIGMSAFFLIEQYVRFEYSYDNFVTKKTASTGSSPI